MQKSIADILGNPDGYADQIVNTDGILLVAEYDRGNETSFEHVWLLKQGSSRNHAIRAQPIRSDSTLWHGLSRLNPRHLPGHPAYRVHDAVRACVRVLGAGGAADRATPRNPDGSSLPPRIHALCRRGWRPPGPGAACAHRHPRHRRYSRRTSRATSGGAARSTAR